MGDYGRNLQISSLIDNRGEKVNDEKAVPVLGEGLWKEIGNAERRSQGCFCKHISIPSVLGGE